MSKTSTPLVPEKEVYPVCSNGMQTGIMIVKSQSKIRNAKGHYLATYLDKPANFKCVYLGILVALIGGIITALFFSGAGAVIAGILIATLAGVIASYGLGGAVCSYCLDSAMWDKTHSDIIIDGKVAIIGSSKIICQPLFFPSGTIQIFYSKEVADKVSQIYATQNILKIFGAAVTGWGVPQLIMSAPAFLSGLATNGVTTLTVLKVGGAAVGFCVLPNVTDFVEEKSSDFFSDVITGSTVDTNQYEVKNSSGLPIDVMNHLDDATTGTQETATGLHTIATLTSKPTGSVMKTSWILEKMDPRFYMQSSNKNTLRSIYTKEGWSIKKDLENFKNDPDSKASAAVTCLSLLGNIIGKTIYKCMAKYLDEWGKDAEMNAQKSLGIFELRVN